MLRSEKTKKPGKINIYKYSIGNSKSSFVKCLLLGVIEAKGGHIWQSLDQKWELDQKQKNLCFPKFSSNPRETQNQQVYFISLKFSLTDF